MRENVRIKEIKRQSLKVEPSLADREFNRTKSIIQGLEKDFRCSRDPESAFEYWQSVLEKISIFEKARRRDFF